MRTSIAVRVTVLHCASALRLDRLKSNMGNGLSLPSALC
jgi:hypothetical protein